MCIFFKYLNMSKNIWKKKIHLGTCRKLHEGEGKENFYLANLIIQYYIISQAQNIAVRIIIIWYDSWSFLNDLQGLKRMLCVFMSIRSCDNWAYI